MARDAGVCVVEFSCDDPRASEMAFLGRTDGCGTIRVPMVRDKAGTWRCRVRLAAGAHHFRYLVRHSEEAGWPMPSPAAPFEHSVAISAEQPISEDHDEVPAGPLDGLSDSEAALIRGFRRLPDEESRSAFLDALQDSVCS